METIQSYLPTIHLDWNQEEVKNAFVKSLVLSGFCTSIMYYGIEKLLYSKSENRSRMICYVIPLTFNGLKLMYAVSIWTSTVIHFMNKNEIVFEDKDVNIVIYSVFVQFLVMDTLIGQDYYPKTLRNRWIKNLSQFVLMTVAFANHQVKWLGFFWLSEYSEVMRYLTLISGIPSSKTDILIYRMTHISFQVIYPSFLIWQIYMRHYPIANYLWGTILLCHWFEMCQFSFWMIDQIYPISQKKEVKKE